jgi:protein-S-isoprenylcysteine O-methyltransferase Ste14
MKKVRAIFERQWLHGVLLLGLLTSASYATRFERITAGEALGVTTVWWFWAAIAVAVVHQVYIWLCWRTELHASALTKLFGEKAFAVYAGGFAVLGITRVVLVVVLAASNQGTVPISPIILKVSAIVALMPALYVVESVRRYFSFKRAFGIDHFDPSYRDKPFVREGIFRFTRNGMYVFGFLILWVPALWYGSAAGLVVALFHHVYIWVHYYTTEAPDMRRIYGDPLSE